MIVACMRGRNFACLKLSFDSGKPGSSIFSPKLSEAKANIANAGSGVVGLHRDEITSIGGQKFKFTFGVTNVAVYTS